MGKAVRWTLACLLSAFPAVASAAEAPAFPGAEGWGAVSRGARGCDAPPQVLVVDTLEDENDGSCSDGDCTLRDALLTPTPRYIVSNAPPGVFHAKLNQAFEIRDPCYTLNFSTAPTVQPIAEGMLKIEAGAHHGIIRYVQIASGHTGVHEVRGIRKGCNAFKWRCADGERRRPTERICAGRDDRISCRGLGSNDCRPFEVARLAWSDPARKCSRCDAWDPANPTDFTRCNDAQAVGGTNLDNIQIRGDVQNTMIDHVTFIWSCDENVNLGARSKPYRNLSITNSLIGNGIRSDGTRFICHREKNHDLAFIALSQGDLTTDQGVTVAHNLLLNSSGRLPLLANIHHAEWKNNIHYNVRGKAFASIGGFHRQIDLDVVGNLFHHGPDWTAVTQPNGHAMYHGVGNPPGRLFLDNNAYLDKHGRNTGPVEPEEPFDREWARMNAWSDRADWWPLRRTQELFPGPEFPVTLVDTSASENLEVGILPQVGASLPCRSPLDRALVDSYASKGGYVTPTTHPKLAGTRWSDSDGDGIDDAWEMRHFEDLTSTEGCRTGCEPGPHCVKGCHDADGNGRPDVEEWLDGTDPNDPGDVTDDRRVVACTEG